MCPGCHHRELLDTFLDVFTIYGSNGIRGEVFVRDGELEVKLSKVEEVMEDDKHTIEANLAPLATLGTDEGAVNSIITSVYADIANPFRR